MKKLFWILLLLPVFSFAQDITGKWTKGNTGIEFTADGLVKLFDIEYGEKPLNNIIVKYRLEVDKDIKVIVFETYHNGKLLEQRKDKYKIEGQTLLLPKTTETNGKIIVEDYADAYERRNS